MLAGCEHLRTFPLDAFEIDQVPGEHRLAFEHIEPVACETATLGHDHTLSTFLWNINLCLEVVRGRDDARCVTVWRTGIFTGVGEHAATGREARTRLNQTGEGGCIQRQNLVLLRLFPEKCVHLLNFLWVLCCHIFVLRPVFAQIVQLPWPARRVRVTLTAVVPRHTHDLAACDPAVVIDRVITKHLEVLRLMRRSSVFVLLVEGVGHTHAFDRLLRNTVHYFGLFKLGCFQDRRHDVDDVVKLVTDATLVLDHLRPGDHHTLLGTTEVRCNHLGP